MKLKELVGTTIAVAALTSAAAFSKDLTESLPLRDSADCLVPGALELREKFGVSEHTAKQRELMDLERRACQLFGSSLSIEAAINEIVADDGVVLLMEGGILHDKKTQILMFQEYFDAGYDIVWEPVHAEVSGDIGWVIGVIKETRPDGSVNFGKYVSTWRKIEGKWLNTIEMRNGNGGVPLVN